MSIIRPSSVPASESSGVDNPAVRIENVPEDDKKTEGLDITEKIDDKNDEIEKTKKRKKRASGDERLFKKYWVLIITSTLIVYF